MQLQFDPNMDYQLKAINSALALFKGQAQGEYGVRDPLTFPNADKMIPISVIGNRLSVGEEVILENLRAIQASNGLACSTHLAGRHFSFEMETGTGKTYVYLRTIYALYQCYGFKKFIVVVPNVAIREGVEKTIAITRAHFREHFANVAVKSFVYSSTKLSQVRDFAMSTELQLMIINMDNFNKKSNVFNSDDERMGGVTLQELVRAVQPILILDEPQNMESEISKASIARLSPLVTLRYSATHRHKYNLVYCFDPVAAYQLGKVKRIEVAGVTAANAYSGTYIKVLEIKSAGNDIWARIEIYWRNKAGEAIAKKKLRVRRTGSGAWKNRELFLASGGLSSYEGFVVETISTSGEGEVTFSNGVSLRRGAMLGGYTRALIRRQIRETLEEHFSKEKKLVRQGIKVLSLFFIDRVAHYTGGPDGQAGFIKQYFLAEFNALKQTEKYKEQLAQLTAETIIAAYFAKKKDAKKEQAIDTKGYWQADEAAYKLIMREKEQLLSLANPVRFIFSHSALREGWDNPNVFNICTLRAGETFSYIKKRQEIGRGLRICVDQDGQRNYEPAVNRLTVIANESYAEYAQSLQQEYKEAGVMHGVPIVDKAARQTVRRREDYVTDNNFKDLWEKIKHRTYYKVKLNSQKLIEKCVEKLNKKANLASAVKISVDKAKLDLSRKHVGTELTKEGRQEVVTRAKRPPTPIPDILTRLERETGLTRPTLAEILRQLKHLADIFKNPEEFILNVGAEINDCLQHELLGNIRYIKSGKCYGIACFAETFEAYEDSLIPLHDKNKGIYDYIEVESQTERTQAESFAAAEKVKFFIKLPRWFKVNTPIGTYNPDWALALEQDKKVYMVVETKASPHERHLRATESAKIACGRKHFAELAVKYAVKTPTEPL